MSDHDTTEKPKELSVKERLARLELALTSGLRIDLEQYDQDAINAARAAWAEETGVKEVEEAKAAELAEAEQQRQAEAEAEQQRQADAEAAQRAQQPS